VRLLVEPEHSCTGALTQPLGAVEAYLCGHCWQAGHTRRFDFALYLLWVREISRDLRLTGQQCDSLRIHSLERCTEQRFCTMAGRMERCCREILGAGV
jgi:hypothetical protein